MAITAAAMMKFVTLKRLKVFDRIMSQLDLLGLATKELSRPASSLD
jgi:hypothetical protein